MENPGEGEVQDRGLGSAVHGLNKVFGKVEGMLGVKPQPQAPAPAPFRHSYEAPNKPTTGAPAYPPPNQGGPPPFQPPPYNSTNNNAPAYPQAPAGPQGAPQGGNLGYPPADPSLIATITKPTGAPNPNPIPNPAPPGNGAFHLGEMVGAPIAPAGYGAGPGPGYSTPNQPQGGLGYPTDDADRGLKTALLGAGAYLKHHHDGKQDDGSHHNGAMAAGAGAAAYGLYNHNQNQQPQNNSHHAGLAAAGLGAGAGAYALHQHNQQPNQGGHHGFVPPVVGGSHSSSHSHGAGPVAGLAFFGHANKHENRNYCVLMDRSSSMASTSTTSLTTYWEDAKQAVATLAPYICRFDPDGVDLILFDSVFEKFPNVRSSQEVCRIFQTHRPQGGTFLHTALESAFQDHFSRGSKPTTILVVTDGAPNFPQPVVDIIRNAANRLQRDSDLSVSFIQIGQDRGAQQFLRGLDDALPGAKFDIVDALGYDQLPKMSFAQLIQNSIES